MACKERTSLVVAEAGDHQESWRTPLTGAGFRVLDCPDRATAVDMADRRQPDLIAWVLKPGEHPASHWIEKLRAHPSAGKTPVLLVGSELDPNAVESALAAGADEYIQLPCPPAEFRLRADRAIRARQATESGRLSRGSLERELDATRLLQRFYEQILANDAVEETCRQSVETAAKLMGSNRVSMLLTDSRDHSLRFAYAVGMDSTTWRDQTVPLSSPVVGRVLATRREMVVNRNSTWPRQSRYQAPQFVSMPLLRGSTPGDQAVVGVLNVTDRQSSLDYEPADVLALSQLARAAAFAIDAVRTRRKLDETRDSIIFSLARLSEYRHASTGKHLERVRELSLVLARHLAEDPRAGERIDRQFLSDLGRAAPLHDVGKVAIPDRILLKEGRLTDEEFALIRNHTAIGAATLQSVMSAGHDDSFLQMAMEIAHCHHERYDGQGYPRGLCGEEIPLSARIVCLADSYDAIRMAREYKPARSHREAVRELLLGSGSQFDPIVVQAFCAVEDQFERIYNNLMEQRGQSGTGLQALMPVTCRA